METEITSTEREMTNFIRRSYLAAAALLAASLLSACSAEKSQAAAAPPPVPVTVTTVEQKTVPLEVTGIGNVQAFSTVNVKAQSTGELMKVHFDEGGDVHEGQLLFTIDRRPAEAAVAQAEATLAKDMAEAAHAKSQASRYEKLMAEGVVAREQYEQTKSQAEAWDATVKADQAAVENARVQLAYTTIKAPISGRTGNLLVHQGNVVKANETDLVVINQIVPVNVELSIPEQFLDQIKQFNAQRRLDVRATMPTGESFGGGRLSFFDNTVDQKTGTIKLKATFQNDKRVLWPGQFVNVALTLEQQANRIVVPAQAVQTGQQGQFVFVVKDDKTAEVRNIRVERTNEREAVIAEGLNVGETIVTDGQVRLFPGAKVDVKQPEPAAGN
jgi:membrane fusion protein, multidrug efflux system